ncbi:PREDICTED: uncharacterized protein C1orf186 homolog [Pseudopodoces humilis]|uniref:uncharacterized protein C1orf186 homolog n=1 Tax=Pseudopodoces humilis TaxID=181119 RepID=UPI0006B7AB42|nr:PREDICTED: uncharacterized protein C1orf186 homolog [Pseudopodoces humilis]
MSSCACWIPAVTSLGTLVLHALLLLVLYIMLSRKIAQHSRGMQMKPSPAPASSLAGDRAQNPRAQKPSPAYAGSSDTSSDTSEDSDSPSCPQVPQEKTSCSEENIHYTSLVFPGKGHEPGSAQDYKNMKSGMDYVNVDPKKRKIYFCPFSSPEGSKGVEYTQVKL